MLESFLSFYQEYGLEILAGLSLFVIFILFVVNYFSGEKGSYTNVRNALPALENDYFTPSTIGKEHTGKDSKLEIKSKFILENIFKRPFTKIRPNFLRNDVTGENLEIDLYNPDLKLGFEINGQQHYKFVPFFQKNHEAFRNQQYRDHMKREKCRQNGITLVEVPYSVGENGLKNFIVEQLRLNNFLL